MKNSRYFVGDFETTVFKSQTKTEVWASALVEVGTEDVVILHSIDDTFKYLMSLESNITLYYHNLKFDGTFWLYFLMNTLHYKLAVEGTKEEPVFLDDGKMPKGSYKYVISSRGQWYFITIRLKNGYLLNIRDSLKLLPFSVRKIGESFGTKHKKLDMEYEGMRYAGCEITPEEQEYIKNDVLVVKEAIEIMFAENHKKLTIGACCMSEYKSILEKYEKFNTLFPQLYDQEILTGVENCPNTVGEFILKSYKGGWCYVAKGKENKVYHNGLTVDANSLYPSVMHSESGNRYPTGSGVYIKIQDKTLSPILQNVLEGDNGYFYVRLRTRFKLKPNMLPTIQIKGSNLYRATEWLETSDVYNKKTGKYYRQYIDLNGEVQQAIPELTLSWTDYLLLITHYDLEDTYFIDAIYFPYTEVGLFDMYINRYREIKMNSKGAKREMAKLFLNNLYGKFATKTDSSFKLANIDRNFLSFKDYERNDKVGGYIAVGAAITSYARYTTITLAQKNYYGANKAGFIYADTDSLHCDLSIDQLKGIPIDDNKFCCWKVESEWKRGLFVRQKTYIEQKKNDKYIIRCAGLPDFPKRLFLQSLGENALTEKEMSCLNERERAFIEHKNEITDFNLGLVIPSKLMPKQIEGGTVLVSVDFSIR